MRAVVVPRHGGPEVLEIVERPIPRPGPGEVLVRVHAAGINHLDTFVRRGMPGIKLPLPMTPGSDAAGVIAALGPDPEAASGGAPLPKVGDRVFVSPGYSCERCEACYSGHEPLCRHYGLLGEHRDGTQAEYLALRATHVLPLPEGISFEAGAAFPLVFLTAWQMLVGRAALRAGETVLIQAGGSGVGSAAIQIAHLLGARVLTTVGSDDKVAKARALGADVVINYRTSDFLDAARKATEKRGVDVVVENTGQETWERSLLALAKGGRLVTCGATTGYAANTDLRHVFFKSLSILGSTMGSRADLLRIARFVGEGRLKPVVDRVLPLDQVADGHRALAERSLFGKIVLTTGGAA
ncbi:MAG TPA: zinc-binding dehydrogenase [Candidatus Polarisedimenticolia bacterium]|nr:zinc-binding dehydrogenase [Candidatus Polarisedimenticolia bacterium]